MKKFVIFAAIFVLALGICVPTRAEELGAVKARMEKRLAQVEALKLNGAVGENNRGYLEARGAGADSSVIAAENGDRDAVYVGLAKQTGSSPDQVGRARARQIAQRARAGEWIQDDRGEWRKK